MAQKFGKLLKGGEGDTKQAAVMLINDLQRGKIPYFVPPEEPEREKEEEEENGTITEAFVDELNKEGTKLLAKEELNEKEKEAKSKSKTKAKAKGAEEPNQKESEAANDSTNESSRNNREDAILLTL